MGGGKTASATSYGVRCCAAAPLHHHRAVAITCYNVYSIILTWAVRLIQSTHAIWLDKFWEGKDCNLNNEKSWKFVTSMVLLLSTAAMCRHIRLDVLCCCSLMHCQMVTAISPLRVPPSHSPAPPRSCWAVSTSRRTTPSGSRSTCPTRKRCCVCHRAQVRC